MGPAVVSALLAAGAAVVASSRHQAELQALAVQAQAPAERWLGQAADMADGGAAQQLLLAAHEQFGRIDILAAIAGGWRGGKPLADTTADTMDWLWRVNVLTAFNAMQVVLPGMSERGWGRIITMASRSAQGGQARSAAYAASKAAVLTLTQSVAAEVRAQGITANTLLIGTADTPANRSAMPNADSGRWVTPAQIAATIVFLCTEEAAALTGAAIPL